MKKTTKANIGGFAFNVEEDAYNALDSYLAEIRDCYSSDDDSLEIVQDIESRIGELLSELKGGCEVVTAGMVERVKERVGDPSILMEDEKENSGEAAGAQPAGNERKNIRKRFYRDLEHRNIGGVCSGLAAYFNKDVAWFRIGWTALFFAGLFTDGKWIFNDGKFGLYALLAYCIMWICVPGAKTVAQKCEMRGEPVNLGQFRDYVPESEKKVNRGRPFLGRTLCGLIGVLLLISGSGCVIAGITAPFGWQFIEGTSNVSINIYGNDEWAVLSGKVADMLTDTGFWWLAAVNILLLGLGMCYAGVLLTFNVKGPKWHPGLIIFILWLLSLFGVAAFAATGIFCDGSLPSFIGRGV